MARRWGAVAPAIALAFALNAAPARAADDPPPLAATAIFNQTSLPGRPLLIRVVAPADRLIRGDLVARVDSGTGSIVTVNQAVEVPGGSVKHFAMVVPTSRNGTQPTVTVDLR